MITSKGGRIQSGKGRRSILWAQAFCLWAPAQLAGSFVASATWGKKGASLRSLRPGAGKSGASLAFKARSVIPSHDPGPCSPAGGHRHRRRRRGSGWSMSHRGCGAWMGAFLSRRNCFPGDRSGISLSLWSIRVPSRRWRSRVTLSGKSVEEGCSPCRAFCCKAVVRGAALFRR